MKKKSRIHTVNLSEEAEFILGLLLKKNMAFGWFSQYVTNCLLRDFKDKDMDVAYRINKVSMLNLKKDKINAELELLYAEQTSKV